MKNTLAITGLIFFCLLLLCNTTFADVYQYEDENGVFYLTNNATICKKYKCVLILSDPHPTHIKKKTNARTLSEIEMKARAGNANAQILLGMKYFYGTGVPKDIVIAYAWLNLATAQGNKELQNVLNFIGKDMTHAQVSEAKQLSSKWVKGQILKRKYSYHPYQSTKQNRNS